MQQARRQESSHCNDALSGEFLNTIPVKMEFTVNRIFAIQTWIMAGCLGLAFLLWYVMFVCPPLNFWILMSVSTSVLAIVSLFLRFPPFEPEELTWKHLWIGILSSIALYFIFIIGNKVSGWIISGKALQLVEIYERRRSLPASVVTLLLFFPIGCGEELFWRGLVQRIASVRWGWKNGFLFSAFFYTAVHISSGNIMLIGASFVCGCFWGLLYWRTNSIVPCLISHMLWDPLVMVIFPIK